MKYLALIALLSIAAVPARADDPLDPSIANAAVKSAEQGKSKWNVAGAQEAAVRGAANAPAPAATGSAPSSTAPAGKETTDHILASWAHDCPAIGALRASKGSPSQKRGIGVSSVVGNAAAIVSNLRSYWYYTWGTKGVSGTTAKFTPMIYGIGNGNSDVENNLRELDQLRPLPEFVLAYNEPDLSQKIAPNDKTWTKSYAPRLPPGVIPVSPASSSVNDWFQEFMKGENAAKFDRVAIHLYEDVQANDPAAVDKAVADFERRMKIVEKFKKPVWVTEFGLATWHATKESPAKFTDAQAACFMAQVLPYLEEHAERYAWFSPGPDGKTPLYPTLPDALWNLDGSLTPLGELYKQ